MSRNKNLTELKISGKKITGRLMNLENSSLRRKSANNVLVRTLSTLRFVRAAQLGRYALKGRN